MGWAEVKLVMLDCPPGDLCRRRYPGHPRGCPNYGTRPSCPPAARPIGEIVDLSRPVYVVWNAFAFAEHVRRMKRMHPEWSDRQARCCLYWQRGARRDLKGEVKALTGGSTRYVVLMCPEACGVNVTDTMKTIGIVLEWPPINITYQVAVVGYPAEKED